MIEPTIAVAAIGAIPATIAAFAAWRSNQKVKQTHYEITNDHGTNIRHDIDDLAASVREGFSEMRKDIGGLREELRTERIERIEGDRLRVVYNVGG
ncbi:minor tail protein [Mycobacterium phage Fameo]|uniref:Minor tail protein n=1 Tax=Mycobacterium phage Fameo TaxID=2126943 RepID=A0A2R4AP22_9CAUD|nr:minor tail protein [Mycobacterium phage Fameo]AVR76800.1 minor tail protein [Mycobacterium phage Fameo]QGJ88980.1 membrane protein [Mycobacterium phage QueenB2]